MDIQAVITADIGATFQLLTALNALHYIVLRLRFALSKSQFTNAADLAYYEQTQQQLKQAVISRFNLMSADQSAISEGFFNILLNDPNDGILTLMEIDSNGMSSRPWKSYAQMVWPLLRLTYSKDALLNFKKSGSELLNDLKESQISLFNILEVVFSELVEQTEADLKINSGLSIGGNVDLKVKIEASFRFAFGLAAGFFDEFLILDKGNQNLRNVLATEDELAQYISNIVNSLDLPSIGNTDGEAGTALGELILDNPLKTPM